MSPRRLLLFGSLLNIVLHCESAFAQDEKAQVQVEVLPIAAKPTPSVLTKPPATSKPKPRAAKLKAIRTTPTPVVTDQSEPRPAVNERATVAATPNLVQASAPTGGSPTGELEPVLHARGAGITTCMDNILTQAASVIDRPHTAISTWVSQNANTHAFQSLIGLSYTNKSAPNGAAVIIAAPVAPNRCEGASVQIYPTAQSCSVIQAALVKTGKTIATLQGLPVVETQDSARSMLMPTSGAGCVVVTVRPR